MGFKRTSEGRVFFQGSGGSANDSLQADQRIATPSTQVQILSLLKALNDRLKVTQSERKQMREELAAYRDLVESLQDKTSQSERAYLDLEQKLQNQGVPAKSRAEAAEKLAKELAAELEETRKTMLEIEDKTDRGILSLKSQIGQTRKISEEVLSKQGDYIALTKRLDETEARQIDMGIKVENALDQQDKLMRKIDKAIEDRSRFMRKIERIEETVLQTRDSLNAKAMVLLTDQGLGGEREESLEGLDDPRILAAMKESNAQATIRKSTAENNVSWWEKPLQMQAAGLAAVVFFALLAGWFISQAQKPEIPGLDAYQLEDFNAAAIGQSLQNDQFASEEATGYRNETAGIDDSAEFSDIEQNELADSVQSGTASADERASLTYEDDIGTLDLNNEEQLLAALDSNPDRVARAMNEIEPSAFTTGSDQKDSGQTAETQLAPAEPQAEQQAGSVRSEAAQGGSDSPAQAVQSVKTSQPRAETRKVAVSDMKPDRNLPEVVKQIEAQAFEGVAEAQHDLAAIYTAGHGGVPQNYIRAAYWFERAADGGIANAAYNLGVLNHQGLGMLTNIEEALRWYQRAAELGHPEAQYNLGIAYIEGIGVTYDAQKAAEFFENAARQGVMEAAYNLGLIYENGLLGTPQPDEALVWYKTAADQGSPEAKTALEQLAKTIGIRLEDVNKLVESVKITKEAAQAPPSQTPTSAKSLSMSRQSEAARASSEAALSGISQNESSGEQALVAEVQRYLIDSGLYPGPADGINGPLTNDAIRSYQSEYGLETTGEISEELLFFMRRNGEGLTDQGSRAQ